MKTRLTFDEFKTYVTKNIKKYLPEEYNEAKITITPVKKNNGLILDGLLLQTANSNVFPTIYLQDLYSQDYLEAGRDLETIMEKIKDIQLNHAIHTKIDVSNITDIKRVKNRIVPRIVNFEANQDLLKDRPYKQMADLAVTYYIQLADPCQDTMATIAITDSLTEKFGLTTDELHEIALSNISTVTRPTFVNLAEMLASITIPEFDCMSEDEKKEVLKDVVPSDLSIPMYVITSANKTHGASAVLDKAFMEAVHEQLGDIYILPSSVHELIVFPKNDSAPSVSELEGLVREVNRTQVADHEILSDSVYTHINGILQKVSCQAIA